MDDAWSRKSHRLFSDGSAAAPSAGALPRWLRSAVALYGDVREVRLPVSSPRRLVIHIQDIHDVEEAQRNIAGLLEQIVPFLRGTPVVGLEGAAGGFTLAPYRRFADADAVRRAAELLLARNVISGPEFFGLTTPAPVRLLGVEDPALYRENVAVLEDALKEQSADDRAVGALVRAAEDLKAKLFSPELLALDRAVSAYEDGRLSLGDYAVRVARGGRGVDPGPQTRRFLEVLDAEKGLDPARIDAERRRLLDRLAPLLTEGEARRLVEAGLEHRLGRASYGRFHDVLTSLASGHGVPLNDFPAYAAYERSRIRAEGIDGPRLLEELGALARRRRDAAAADERSRNLAVLAEDLRLLLRLTALTLIPTEAARLRARRGEIEALPERLEALVRAAGKPVRLPAISETLRRHEIFYVLAEQRNGPLVDRLLDALDAPPAGHGPAVGLLVAGGFHAPGVREAVLGRGAGYIALTPRLTEVDNLPDPVAAFRPGASPVDRLWNGARQGLHRWLALADEPLAPKNQEADRRREIWRARSLIAATLAAVSLALPAAAAPVAPPAQGQLIGFRDLPADAREGLAGLALQSVVRTADLPPAGSLELSISLAGLTVSQPGPAGLQVRIPLVVAGAEPGNRFRRSAVVTIPSDRRGPGDLRFEMSPVEWRAILSEGWRGFVEVPIRRSLAGLRGPILSPWGTGLEEWLGRRLAAPGTRGLWTVGRATGGLTSFGLLTLKDLAQWSGRTSLVAWTERLILDEERRMVASLRDYAPFGVQENFFFRLAAARAIPLEKLWADMVLQTLGDLGRGVPPVKVLSGEWDAPGPGTDPGRLELSARFAGREWSIHVQASRAPALFAKPEDPSLAQVQMAGGNVRVYFQEPVFSEPDLMRLVTRELVRELAALGRDADLSIEEAHRQAMDPFEELRVALILLRREMLNAVQTFENGLLAGELADVRVDAGALRRGPRTGTVLRDAVHVRNVFNNRAIASGEQESFTQNFGLLPYVLGQGPVSELEDVNILERGLGPLGVPEPRVWAERLGAAHLAEKTGSLQRLARYFRARDRRGRVLPLGDKRGPMIEALSGLVVSLARSVGREAGQRSALEAGAVRPVTPEVLSRAFAESASRRFAPLASTLLAVLSEAGVEPVPGRESDREVFAADLLAVFGHAFEEGYRRLAVLTTAQVVQASRDVQGLEIGVFHLRGALRDSPAVRELLQNLIERRQRDALGKFAPVVLLDAPGFERAAAAEISTGLQYILNEECRTLSAAARNDVVQALGRVKVGFASDPDFELEGRISVAKVLVWVRNQWKNQSLGQVQIFTQDQDRLLQDARDDLAAWVIYLIAPRGLVRLSESMKDAQAEDRLRRHIASNA